MSKKTHNPGDIIQRHLPLTLRAIDGSENKFEISVSSEQVDRRWKEVLVHDAQSINMERAIKGLLPLLFAHGRDGNFGKMPLGGVEKFWLDEAERKCRAIIAFDEDDPEAMRVCAKVKKKYLEGISVGAMVHKWTVLEKDQQSLDGRFVGPLYLATYWEPVEISIAPTPVDTDVGVGRSIDEDEAEEKSMATVTKPEAAPAGVQKSVEEIQREAAAAERKRCTDIQTVCRTFEVAADQYIAKGLSVEDVHTDILKQLAAKRAPISGASGDGMPAITREARDSHRDAAVDGLLMRGGISVKNAAAGSHEFRGMRLRDLAVDCLVRSGVANAHRMSNEDLMTRSMTPDSAFVGILNATVNKTMATAYTAASTTFERWTAKGSNPDFKAKKIIQISEAGELSEITQNGEIPFDQAGGTSATAILATFGRRWGFTRQALINDDIEMLTKLPEAYVRAARRGINRAVYAMLKANPTLEDGNALFSAAHKNLSVAAYPSTDAYNLAQSSMMKQKNIRDVETLNIRPRFVLSGPELFADHAAMLRSTSDPNSANAGRFNAFENAMELIIDAELSPASGVCPFYFASSPADCETIMVTYLNGNESPILESKVGFDFLGIEYRIIHDRGISLVDYRGLHKNPGAVKA